MEFDEAKNKEEIQFRNQVILKKEYEGKCDLDSKQVYTYRITNFDPDGIAYILIEQTQSWFPKEIFRHVSLFNN